MPMTGKLEKPWTAPKQATKGQGTVWDQEKERDGPGAKAGRESS